MKFLKDFYHAGQTLLLAVAGLIVAFDSNEDYGLRVWGVFVTLGACYFFLDRVFLKAKTEGKTKENLDASDVLAEQRSGYYYAQYLVLTAASLLSYLGYVIVNEYHSGEKEEITAFFQFVYDNFGYHSAILVFPVIGIIAMCFVHMFDRFTDDL